jgi:hypothetical protein
MPKPYNYAAHFSNLSLRVEIIEEHAFATGLTSGLPMKFKSSLMVTYNKGPRILKNCAFDISDVNLTKANTKENYLVSYTLPKDFPEVFLEKRTSYSEIGQHSEQQFSTHRYFSDHGSYSMQNEGRAFTDFSCPSEDASNVDIHSNMIYKVSESSKKCNLQEFIPEPFNYENGY